MDVQKYLDRIGFQGNVEISLACLTKLQNAHQLHVPFENLDVFTNRKKVLRVEDLYEQIVGQHRGGWCHELNGLFAWLLKTLGFEIKIISANFFHPERRTFYGDFDHMALIIRLEGQDYLTDVGFGNIHQAYDPIRMTEGDVQCQPGGKYKLSRSGSFWVLQHEVRKVVGHHNPPLEPANPPGSWLTLYRYDDSARELAEFQARCEEYQTGRELALSTTPILIIKSHQGWMVNTLTGRRFTSVSFQGEEVDLRTNQTNLSSQDYNDKLKTVFGIELAQSLDIETIVLKEK